MESLIKEIVLPGIIIGLTLSITVITIIEVTLKRRNMDYILTHPDAKCPSKKDNDKTNAAYDLCTPFAFDLFPGERKTVDTGFACRLPEGKWALLLGRSKLANYNGLTVLGGVIDNNYRGNWGVVLLNTSHETVSFKKHDAICQFVFLDIYNDDFVLVDQLDNTSRGEKGIWSNGK